jgi:hypothetical protein
VCEVFFVKISLFLILKVANIVLKGLVIKKSLYVFIKTLDEMKKKNSPLNNKKCTKK